MLARLQVAYSVPEIAAAACAAGVAMRPPGAEETATSIETDAKQHSSVHVLNLDGLQDPRESTSPHLERARLHRHASTRVPLRKLGSLRIPSSSPKPRRQSVAPAAVSISLIDDELKPPPLRNASVFPSTAARYIVNPEARFRTYWDVIGFIALLFCAIVIPYEVAFLDTEVTVDGLFIVNRIIDVVFILVSVTEQAVCAVTAV